MNKQTNEESALPAWLPGFLKKIGPFVAVYLIYLLFSKLGLPAKIWIPIVLVLGLGAAIFFGGRFYKKSFIGPGGRCMAKEFAQRKECRHFLAGATLSGGCGRVRDDGRCRYVIR